MVREFSAEKLVVLPKLSVDSGLALWRALQAGVAAEKKLPRFLQPIWNTVERAGTTLFQAAQTRLGDSSSKRPAAAKRKADLVVDNAAGAMDEYLEAWTRLPAKLAKVQIAINIRQKLFPDGTGFLKLSYEEEWAQIERRLALIKSERLDEQMAQLGGEEFVTTLQEAHLEYGKALGLTTVPTAPAETVALRDPLDALSSALRSYVVKVSAYGDEDKPETMALSERLLRPLMTWTSKAPKSGGGEDDPAPDAAPGA